MKKRILLLFVAMIGMATSVGWAQETPEKSSFEGTEQDVTNFKSYMGIKNEDPRTWKIIYGNGYEMTIEKTADATADNQVTITFPGVTFSDHSNTITITGTDNAIIFGGSKETDLDKDTKITLKSGSVGYLIGGGWGTREKGASNPKTANVKDVAIDIQGGTVGLIYSGGLYRSNVNDITLNVKNATVSHIYCGGFDQGKTTNTLDTEWSSSVNHVNKSTLTMENSTVLGYLFLGGGQGYSYSKEVEANVLNSTLHCGILGTGSNGRSDKVTATVTGCKFEKANKQTDIIEIAPLNRGIIKEISMTFDGCTFPSNTSDYAAYLGATYAYDGKSKVELGKVNVEFKNNCTNTPIMCLSTGLSKADATVTGTKVIAAPSVTTGSTTEKAYTIDESKTWIFNNGFEITEDVTLSNKGVLTVKGIYTVATAAQLEEAIKQTTIDAIELSGSEYTLTDPLKIKSPITLSSIEGAPTKATIKGNLIVEAENVSIKNLAFNCESTGTNYWLKNAITLFGNAITVKDCTFTGSTSNATKYVANGIVIFPMAAENASYDITGNTFTNFNQEVGSGEDYWASTALLLCDNTSITKKDGATAAIPALTSWNESSLANANNTFTSCFADYIHLSDGSYVYEVTSTAKAVADGINSIKKDKQTGTIVATSVDNDAILDAVKELKPSLEGQFIVKSAGGSIVADQNLVSTGTVYVLSKGEDGTYALTQQTVAPEVTFPQEATAIEAGQPLSASILSGGSANVSGVFSWKNPATIAQPGEKIAYPVIFTPTDLTTYNVAEGSYIFAEIKQYFTVQTGKCANGHLEIASANTANKYEKGSKLTVKPVADVHYEFDKYLNKSGFTDNTYTVSENATLTAEFKPIMRKVTINITGTGSVNVNGESKSNSSTVSVQEGSVLTIQAVPGEGQVLSKLTAGGSALNSNTVTVDKDLTIAATFTQKLDETYVVKVDAVPNGKINLYDKDGNDIASGSSFKEDETISVVAVPDLGYKLKDNSLKYNSVAITNNQITVAKADAAITAEFEIQSFTVSTSVTNGTVTLKNKNSETVEPGSIEYGTELTATAEATDKKNYKLLSLVVNGKEIPNGGSFTVTAKTTVTAVMAKLATITIDDTPQSFTYDGTEKEFVIKTTPAGIGGFTVKYDGGDDKPANAVDHADKTYNVTITRAADDTYAAFSGSATLTIKPAQMKGVAIPTLNGSDELEQADMNKGYTLDGTVDGKTHIGKVTFTPTNANYAVMTFYAAGTQATECTYSSASKLQSAKLMTRADDASSLNIDVTEGKGSVKVLNGGVVASKLYVGQTITIQAVPASTEYAANAIWNNNTTTTANTYTMTLGSGTNEVTVAFQKKTEPTPTLTIPTDMVYNGTPFAGQAITVANESPVKDWDLSFDGTPTDAGTYTIYASRKADENYLAVVKKGIKSFTIKQAPAEASNPIATDILQGQALAQSVITGTANVDGAFEWVNPNTIPNAGTAKADVRFVPTSKNYSVKDGLTADVKVTETGVTIRTLNLTVVGEEFGTVSMTLDGNPTTPGATVTKGQELKVTATAKTGYEASVQIDGSARTSYTIGETGNVEVKVTFTKKSEPSTPTDPDPEPEVIDVTGVSLDATAKTLAVGESFVLKATVKPADADNKKVSWSSSNATIASVDKDGNVNALKAGTCKITVTTEDGDYTATCDITVTIATGIDELLAANRIYTDYGQIIVEPTTSLEVLITDMTGRIVYHDRIAEKITVPVSGGIYIVRLVESKRVATTKVIVK